MGLSPDKIKSDADKSKTGGGGAHTEVKAQPIIHMREARGRA